MALSKVLIIVGDASETLLDQLGLSKAQVADLQSSEVVNG